MLDKELAATILLEAIYTTDEQTCRRYNISTRTLRRWRKQLASDEELAAFVHTKKEKFDEAWAESLPVALRQSIEFIGNASARASADPDSYRNPALIHAVAGALKVLAEVYYTGKVIDARIARRTDEPVDDWKN